MTVICQSKKGAIIDHLKYINSLYGWKQTISDGCSVADCFQLQFNADFFDIHAPYMMDSQFEKLKTEVMASDEGRLSEDGHSNQANTRKRKKRKRRYDELTETERNAKEYHHSVVALLQQALVELVALAHDCDYLLPSSGLPRDNNLCARNAAKVDDCSQPFVELMKRDTNPDIITVNDGDQMLVNGLIHHHCDDVHVKKVFDGIYLLPPKSSFLMSDISYLKPLISAHIQYDLIVLDPPWYNKSVRRKSKYQMLYDEDLLHLPLESLTKPGCLVIVWATNNQQQQQFIQQRFFPRWHIQYVARWFWLKVTQHGQPIIDLENEHRKPYETLFIGCVSGKELDTPDHPDYATKPYSGNLKSKYLQELPDDYVLISIPSSLHSHKPPLADVLKPFLPEQPTCLEMFARCLMPGWTSWGNEVLKLQHSSYYTSSDQSGASGLTSCPNMPQS